MNLWKLQRCAMFPLLLTRNDLQLKSLRELLILQSFYLRQIEQAKDECEGEYAFQLYCLIVQRIDELANQSPVGTSR